MARPAPQFHDEQVRGACGLSEPDMALFVQDGRDSVDGTALVIDLSLSNASARPMSVERLIPALGLRVVGVASRDGTPVALPLLLEPGDFDPPVDPFFGSGPETSSRCVSRSRTAPCTGPPSRTSPSRPSWSGSPAAAAATPSAPTR